MEMPDYYLTRPVMGREKTEDFDHLYEDIVGKDGLCDIDYTLKTPKWQFLCYLAETKNILLNSSQAAVDQQTVDLGVPIVNSNGYWMIPIRPVAESLGLQVIDNTDGSIQIRT